MHDHAHPWLRLSPTAVSFGGGAEIVLGRAAAAPGFSGLRFNVNWARPGSTAETESPRVLRRLFGLSQAVTLVA